MRSPPKVIAPHSSCCSTRSIELRPTFVDRWRYLGFNLVRHGPRALVPWSREFLKRQLRRLHLAHDTDGGLRAPRDLRRLRRLRESQRPLRRGRGALSAHPLSMRRLARQGGSRGLHTRQDLRLGRAHRRRPEPRDHAGNAPDALHASSTSKRSHAWWRRISIAPIDEPTGGSDRPRTRPCPPGPLSSRSRRRSHSNELRPRTREAGRLVALHALALAGCDAAELPPRSGRRPAWPAGFVGSIAHDDALAVAVAARIATRRAPSASTSNATTHSTSRDAVVVLRDEELEFVRRRRLARHVAVEREGIRVQGVVHRPRRRTRPRRSA